MEAPSQGGELVAWIHHQLTHSEERIASADFAADAAFHRGIVMSLREVLTGLVPLVAERDALRGRAETAARWRLRAEQAESRAADLEAAQRWHTLAAKRPAEDVAVLLRRGGAVRVAKFYADDIGGMWALVGQWHDVVVDASQDDHWLPLPAGPEVAP